MERERCATLFWPALGGWCRGVLIWENRHKTCLLLCNKSVRAGPAVWSRKKLTDSPCFGCPGELPLYVLSEGCSLLLREQGGGGQGEFQEGAVVGVVGGVCLEIRPEIPGYHGGYMRC